MIFDIRVIERRVIQYKIEAASAEEAEEKLNQGGIDRYDSWWIDEEIPIVQEWGSYSH